MLDLLTEDTLTLAEAARLLPARGGGGKKTNISTLLRWILRGAPGPDGARVRLDACRFGGRWVTSREAIARFVAALTPRLDGAASAPSRRGDRDHGRAKASQRAAAELEKLGV